MSTLREAAEKALETLTDSRIGRCDYMDGVEIYSDFNDAAEALRAELAKPDARPAPAEPQPAAQQEPLFWYRPRSDGLYEGPIHNAQIERARKESGGWVPLYTQAGERKPLTDEQVLPLMKQAGLASKKCDSKPVATIEKTQPKPAQKKGPQ